MLFKNRISGELIDAAYIPGASGRGTLCVLTDGSFSYFSRKRQPGKQVSGQKGILCKTYLYGYDPVSRKVLYKKSTKYDHLPPDASLVLIKDILWQISSDPAVDTQYVYGLDPVNGEIKFDTSQFNSRFSQLSSGVLKQSLTPYPPYIIRASSRDGREVYIDVAEGHAADNVAKLIEASRNRPMPISVFALGDPDGGVRRRVWKMTGTNANLYHLDLADGYFNDPEYFKRNYQAEAELMPTEEVFLEGVIVYQDGEIAVILHQESVGKNSGRLLTCIDGQGKILWRLDQAQLFPSLALKESDPYSTLFFVRSRLSVKRKGDVLLIVFKPDGWIGLNAANGSQLWRQSL